MNKELVRMKALKQNKATSLLLLRQPCFSF